MVTFANAINSTIGASISGVTNTLTVQNPSNTASSQASELITVGGTSSGSCWTQYTVGSSASYSLGIDTQNSGGTGTRSIVLSSTQTATCSPTSGNILFSITSAASSLASAATFWVPSVAIGGLSNAGANTFLNIANASTTAGSDASINLQVSATTGGNAHIDYTGPANNWSHGIVKASSNAWKLTTAISGTFPYSSVVINASTAGQINYPLQPAFLAYVNTTTNNVTGDGTVYTLIPEVEVFDQSNSYDTTTGTFTAPITGRYQINAGVGVTQLGVANTSGKILIVTSNRTYQNFEVNYGTIAAGGADANAQISTLADMDSADTAIVQVAVSGGTKIVDIRLVNTMNFISGFLAC